MSIYRGRSRKYEITLWMSGDVFRSRLNYSESTAGCCRWLGSEFWCVKQSAIWSVTERSGGGWKHVFSGIHQFLSGLHLYRYYLKK